MVFVVIACAVGAGCASSHAGRTLGKGVIQGDVSLGGPFVTNLGPPIPVPNLPVGVRYGVTDRIDVSGHINLLPIVMGGFLAFDTSMTWAIFRHEGDRGPNLATSVGFMLFTDFKEGARISPVVDFAGGYTYKWFTVFGGFDVGLDYWSGRVHFNPFAGFEFDLPRRVTLHLAWKWFSPAYDWFASSIRWAPIEYQGPMGFILGVKFAWDLNDRKAGGK